MLIFARDYHNLPVVRSKYLIEFLGWNKLYFNLKFVVISLYSHLSSCTHLRELSRYKNEKQFSSVTLNWLKSTKTKWRFLVGITMFLGNKTNNGISLSLKHTCPLHVEDWRVRMSRSRELFNSWNGYQKLYTGITWFSDSFQAGIFVAEHEGWIKKKNVYLLKK